jgi:D-aminopeptidase
VLTINGAPVGQQLNQYYLKDELHGTNRGPCKPEVKLKSNDLRLCADVADGSIIIVIAIDAPVDARQLKRMGARAMMGLARTGAAASNGSGDYAIAFSTSPDVRIQTLGDPATRNAPRSIKVLDNDSMSPLFLAVIEATEEAIYNSLFRATTITGRGHTVEALPVDRTLEILLKHNALTR